MGNSIKIHSTGVEFSGVRLKNVGVIYKMDAVSKYPESLMTNASTLGPFWYSFSGYLPHPSCLAVERIMTTDNKMVAYVLTRLNGESWTDALVRLAEVKFGDDMVKRRSVIVKYFEGIGNEKSEEQAAWFAAFEYDLLEQFPMKE